MSQLSTDLEANLVTERTDPPNQPNDHLLLLQNQPISSQDNNLEESRNQTEYTIPFNFLAVFVPGPKILASIAVLLVSDAPCIGGKQIWLMCMLAHDFLHFVIILMRLQTIFALGSLYPANSSQAGQSGERPQQSIELVSPARNGALEQPDQENSNQQPLNEDSNASINKILEKRATISNLMAICTFYWMFLFIFWLELDIITEASECDTEEINNLVLAYALIGWAWLLNPLIICVTGFLCLPLVLIAICIFGKANQVPAPKKIISKLPVKTYTPEIPGNKECAICIVEYQPNDKIVQLECSAMHHFHEPCLKGWLKINGQCPICRARIEATKK